MDTYFLALPLAVLLGSMSPGPSFIVVAKASISDSRRGGVLAALGMGIGSVLLACASLLGVTAVLDASAYGYISLKVLGATYLMFVAYKLWRTAAQPLDPRPLAQRSTHQSAWILAALATQLTNPKTLLFYASVFASLMPRQPPLLALLTLPCLVFLVEFCWYSVVAIGFSRATPRHLYARAKRHIDRLAAVMLGGLGVSLATTISSPDI